MSVAGEVLRMRDQIQNLRGLIDGLEMTIGDDIPCSMNAQSIADAAIRLVAAAARHDADMRSEAAIAKFNELQDRISKLPGSRT